MDGDGVATRPRGTSPRYDSRWQGTVRLDPVDDPDRGTSGARGLGRPPPRRPFQVCSSSGTLPRVSRW